MRTVVIGTKNGKAAVAGANGCMCYIDDKGYQTGQILELDESVFGVSADENKASVLSFGSGAVRYLTRNASGLAAALAVAVITGGICAYAAPVMTVEDSENQGVSYSLNAFDRVVSVNLSEGDSDITSGELSFEVSGKKLDEAIEITRAAIEEKAEEEKEIIEESKKDIPAEKKEPVKASEEEEQETESSADISVETEQDIQIQTQEEAKKAEEPSKPDNGEPAAVEDAPDENRNTDSDSGNNPSDKKQEDRQQEVKPEPSGSGNDQQTPPQEGNTGEAEPPQDGGNPDQNGQQGGNQSPPPDDQQTQTSSSVQEQPSSGDAPSDGGGPGQGQGPSAGGPPPGH
ncbi:MAG: hypothetical protein K6E91_07175 [Butyrivibrio sp.]|nr:hypothetical protein [Butyrivibrio sp.]